MKVLSVNIIMKKLCTMLGLPKKKPIPYNLLMVNQTTTKWEGLIEKRIKMYVHGIPYINTLIILQNHVLD